MLRPEESPALADHRSLLPRRLLPAKAQIAPADKRKNRRSLELSLTEPNDCHKRGLLLSKTTDSLTNSAELFPKKNAIRQDSTDSLKRGLLSKTTESLTNSIELCQKKTLPKPDSNDSLKRVILSKTAEALTNSLEICPKKTEDLSDNLKRTVLSKESLSEIPKSSDPSAKKLFYLEGGLGECPKKGLSNSEQAKKLFFLANAGEEQCAKRGLLETVAECGEVNGGAWRGKGCSGVLLPWETREERVRPARGWYAGYGTLPHDSPDKTGSGAAAAEGPVRGSPGAPRRALDFLLGPGLRTLASRRHHPAHPAHPVRRAASRDSALDALGAPTAPSAPSALHAEDEGLRKCSTVLALSGRSEPLRAVNRLRAPSVCSRCSSLLSLAGGSRYSLDGVGVGFAPVLPEGREEAGAGAGPVRVPCKLCLEDAPPGGLTSLRGCGCAFCTKCMQAYVEFEVCNGAYEVSCPDAQCRLGGALAPDEVEALVGRELLQKHFKFRLNHEVAMDRARAFCPRAGCDTVVAVRAASPAHCPACRHDFCPDCDREWHGGLSCEAAGAAADGDGGGGGGPGAPLLPESDLIKWCPMCRVPIEKDEGCAQMMCKRCKHVFCWYCLASLDDDFLLRHYDKGPCKNKLGHSRASVIWHRAQVVGIFAGFGLLLLVASPLLLLAAPCIVCCKCRLCNPNGAKNLDEVDETENTEQDKEGVTEGEAAPAGETSRARGGGGE